MAKICVSNGVTGCCVCVGDEKLVSLRYRRKYFQEFNDALKMEQRSIPWITTAFCHCTRVGIYIT